MSVCPHVCDTGGRCRSYFTLNKGSKNIAELELAGWRAESARQLLVLTLSLSLSLSRYLALKDY